MELRVLGPIEATAGDGPVDLGGARQVRGLVALAAAGRPLSIDELAERAWDDEDRPADPTAAVRMAIRRLRAVLGDEAIATRPGGYELVDIALDSSRFEELARAGRAVADPVAATTALRRALDLWRGAPFGNLDDLEWLRGERARLEELYLSTLEAWVDTNLQVGATTEILPQLEGSVADHPLRDKLRRQLMLALYRAGRQAEALRVFQDYGAELVEAGLEPPTETVELERGIARSDSELLTPDDGERQLRGYRISERLGEGAFSIVYRGAQPSVDRDVAIKQIRAELVNRPEFIRRFETEAHLVASLEHPHIVPLIDYWREPGSAFLVMRLLRGGSLETSVLDHPWSLDRTLAMVDQIAAALATAHRAGIVHRDVKSANILLDEDGNAYLSDFGIALEVADPEAALSAGSPAYASPEQLRREPVGPSADVHGLAIAVYEALTGRLPFPDEPNQAALLQRQLHDPIPTVRASRTDIPGTVDQVLQKATAKDPAERYQTVDEFAAGLHQAAAGTHPVAVTSRGAITTVTTEARNPYKGLRAFDEADDADFAGRSRLVDQLADTMSAQRLVAVVGPSGSGKSSVVRAGLLPQLRQGRVPGSDDWFVVTMLPGERPFEELENGLVRVATEPPLGLLDLLTDGERGIGRAVRRFLPEDGQLLLIIDQFEELFTLCPDEDERRQFLDALASAVTEERSRLRVVLTLRADFYDRPLRYESIGRLVRDATVPVLPLAADELERAIVDPALRVGSEFEPGLVSEIVADVSDQPGALPMLQYALTELYERRVSSLMLRDTYHELGGVSGALARRAEELVADADDEGRAAVRRVFGRLVSLGEGTEDTRRRALRSELGAEAAVATAVESFGRARLLSFDRDPVSREPTVEVAHEALLREWPRLRGWLDEDRDGLRILRHLNAAAGEWDAAGRPDSELYRGGRLEAAEEFAKDHTDELTTGEREFVAAAGARRAAEQEAERQTNRRLRWLLVGVGVVAGIALVASAVAFQQRARANDRANDAETERLAATAQGLAGENRRVSLLLAVATHQRSPGSLASLSALRDALAESSPLVAHLRTGEPYLDVEWPTSERMIAATATRLELIDPDTGEIIDETALDYPPTLPDGVRPGETIMDATGATLVVASGESAFSVFDISNGLDLLFSAEVEGVVSGVAVFGDDENIAIGSEGQRLSTFDRSGGVLFRRDFGEFESLLDQAYEDLGDAYPFWFAHVEIPVITRVHALDGGLLITTGNQMIRLDETGTQIGAQGRVVRWPFGGDSPAPSGVQSLLPTSDGGAVLTQPAGVLQLRPADLMEPKDKHYTLQTLAGTSTDGEGGAASYTMVGDSLLAHMGDGSLIIFDPRTGGRLGDLSLSLGVGSASAASPHSPIVALAHSRGLTLVEPTGGGVIASSLPRRDEQPDLSISEAGEFVAAGPFGTPGPTDVWTLTGRRAKNTTESVRTDGDFYIDVSPDLPDDLIARGLDPVTGLDTSRLYEWDGDRFQVSFTYVNSKSGTAFHLTDLYGAAARRDPTLVEISDSSDGPFDLESAEEKGIAELLPPPGTPDGVDISLVRFDPDLERILVANAIGAATMYSTEDWEPTMTDFLATQNIVLGRWNADGSLLATASSDGIVTIRNGETLEPLYDLLGSVGASNSFDNSGVLLFSADNNLLLTNVDGSGRLWDLESRQQIGGAFATEPPSNSGVGYDGQLFRLVTAAQNSALVWNLDIESWPEIACQAAGSNLTRAEWEQWGPQGQDYAAVCPQYPIEE
ncbi:MAG: protein kinase [Actinomycetia bacterium]|nr:protein kinase [Actinomycetes bacterium]